MMRMMRMMTKFFQYLMLKEINIIIYLKNKMKKKMNIEMSQIVLQKKN